MAFINQSSPHFSAPTVATPPHATFSVVESEQLQSSGDCWLCGEAIPAQHYLINQRIACFICARQVSEGQAPRNHLAYAASFRAGLRGALLGFILTIIAAILTGWSIGCFGLAVGCLVGICMKTASNGIGGRRFQVAAVLLTLAATFGAVGPVIFFFALKDGLFISNWAHLLRQVAFEGLASISVDFVNDKAIPSAIGIVILLIGLRVAWTMNVRRALSVYGPYNASDPTQES